MRINTTKLLRREGVTNTYAVPEGRLASANFVLFPVTSAGPNPKEPGTLALALDVRWTPDGDFEELERTDDFPINKPAHATLDVPTWKRKDPKDLSERPPVFRLRTIQQGELDPRYELVVKGL